MFSQEKFTQAAVEGFVLLRINFSNAIIRDEKEQAALEKINDHYGYPPLPTVLYTDAQGRPVKTSELKMDVASWLKEMMSARGLLKSLVDGASLKGLDQAKALKTAADKIGLSRVRKFHPEIIAQIKKADPEDMTGFSQAIATDEAFQSFSENVDLLYEEGKIDDILKTADTLLKKTAFLSPAQQQSLHFTRANVFYEKKDTQQAKVALKAVITLDPTSDLAAEANAALTSLD